MMRRLAVSTALLVAVLASSLARADSSSITQELNDEYGKRSYGRGFVWRTGLFGSYHRPRKLLAKSCSEMGGELVQAISLRSIGAMAVKIKDQSGRIGPSNLWEWSSETFNLYQRDHTVSHSPSFPVSYPIPSWVPTDAVGLFGCDRGSGDYDWMVLVMAHHPKLMIIQELLPKELRLREEEIATREEQRNRERKLRDALAEQERLAKDSEQKNEIARLGPWRESLKVGDQTNCGMVVEARGPIVRIQLPSRLVAPNGAREVWIHRTELTDQPAPSDCRL